MSLRFGPFEVDLEGRRLLKRGMPITLRQQSFQVPAALTERPGEIVTREELRRRLWPSDTFVDFEVALNSAVSRLRDALGDSADSPSFIETIPKRGYRFVIPIAKRPAVAVMPFVNQTAEAKDEFLSDGLTDELIRVLSRIEGLRVTAPSVVFRFKGQPCDARQVGRELGVEAVLEGSVWRSGDHIRVTVNLVGVKDGFNLWARRFDSNLKNVFAIQDEVCTAVAEALHVHLAARIQESRPSNVHAYTQYLKGGYLLKKRRPSDVQRAFQYFREAIQLEPGYAEPYYGAAMFYIISAVFGALPPGTALSEAEDLVPKGLALDQNSVRLHSTLGMLGMFQWRWVESEHAHRHAMSLEPANSFPHMVYPILCSLLGRHEEAVSHAVKAVELDPLDLMTNYRLVQANYYARGYDEAVRTGRIAVELTPDSPYTFFYLALALAATGLNDEACSVANKGKQLNDGLPLGEGYFGYLAGVLGHPNEARRVLASYKPVARTTTPPRCRLRGLVSAWAKRAQPSIGWRSGTRALLGLANGVPRLRLNTRSCKIPAIDTRSQPSHLVDRNYSCVVRNPYLGITFCSRVIRRTMRHETNHQERSMQLLENHGRLVASPPEGLKPSHSGGVNVSARVLACYMAGQNRVES